MRYRQLVTELARNHDKSQTDQLASQKMALACFEY